MCVYLQSLVAASDVLQRLIISSLRIPNFFSRINMDSFAYRLKIWHTLASITDIIFVYIAHFQVVQRPGSRWQVQRLSVLNEILFEAPAVT